MCMGIRAGLLAETLHDNCEQQPEISEQQPIIRPLLIARDRPAASVAAAARTRDHGARHLCISP